MNTCRVAISPILCYRSDATRKKERSAACDLYNSFYWVIYRGRTLLSAVKMVHRWKVYQISTAQQKQLYLGSAQRGQLDHPP